MPSGFIMTIGLKDIRDLEGRFARMPQELLEDLRDEFENNLGPELVDQAAAVTPVDNREFRSEDKPHAADEWHFEVETASNGLQIDLYNTTEQMLYLLTGTRPHVIAGNPLLKFFWHKEDVWFVGESVQHPGMQPSHFLEDFNNQTERLILEDVERTANLAITKILG